MPSPFPGMNPYLEQGSVWHDFHQSFMPLAREQLSRQVRPGYVVKVEEHIFIHELSADERRLLGRAELGVSSRLEHTAEDPPTATIDAPTYGTIPLAVDIERHSYLEIRDRDRNQLITVIELLSPANKNTGSDREQYLAKRRQIIHSPAHLVELDLLRGGPRLPVENLPPADYYALVSRSEERPRVGIWPIRLREPLPPVPIPLRAPDKHASLDLQPVLHRVYDSAAYEDYIYRSTPEPPLSPEDAAWAQQSCRPNEADTTRPLWHNTEASSCPYGRYT